MGDVRTLSYRPFGQEGVKARVAAVDVRRNRLSELLARRYQVIPRPAREFLTSLLEDGPLLARMHFCLAEERSRLRNSVLIATEEVSCWGVLLDNDPQGGRKTARERAKRALSGLEMTPEETLERLRQLPVWFLAVDPPFAQPPAGEAPRIEWTIYQLARLNPARIRRLTINDQLDAALQDGDYVAARHLRHLLLELDQGQGSTS